jgi:hypothetical protein
MTAIITVRPYSDTYKARGDGKSASSTNSRAVAVQACADKIAAGRPVAIREMTSETWIATITDPHDPDHEHRGAI